MNANRRQLIRSGTAICSAAAVRVAVPATTWVGAALVATGARAATTYRISARDALLVTDVQRCFTQGGTLAVADADAVVPLINDLAKLFDSVVITQDWHTPQHVSFASSHAGKKPFETTKLPYGTQVLWPDHCIQGTDDAALHPALSIPHAQLIIRKGYHRNTDSYSAFVEADGKTTTGLAAYLKAHGIARVFVAGLATDFCVAWTALDARKAGLRAVVVEDACRGIDTQGSLKAAWDRMTEAGVVRANSTDLRRA